MISSQTFFHKIVLASISTESVTAKEMAILLLILSVLRQLKMIY